MQRRHLPTLLLLAGSVSAAPAPTQGPADPAAVQRGVEHYRIFCANCHGAEADGNGPTAKLLKIAPTNLTLLARMQGGQLDPVRVLKALDGRHLVGGDQKMPVFSESLQINTALDIVEFLKTIQQ
jgi:mono/diheme cytochrome c family protein